MITRPISLHLRLSTRQLNENELETNSIQNKKRIGKWREPLKTLLPVADSCEVEFDFLPMPLPPFGERSWSTLPAFFRSVVVSERLPSAEEIAKENNEIRLCCLLTHITSLQLL